MFPIDDVIMPPWLSIIPFARWDGVEYATLGISNYLKSMSHLTHLPPGQNGRHFADDIFKCTFMNENFCISIQISLKFVPGVPINNKCALVQLITRTNADPVHRIRYAALGGNELTVHNNFKLI